MFKVSAISGCKVRRYLTTDQRNLVPSCQKKVLIILNLEGKKRYLYLKLPNFLHVWRKRNNFAVEN